MGSYRPVIADEFDVVKEKGIKYFLVDLGFFSITAVTYVSHDFPGHCDTNESVIKVERCQGQG